MGALTRAYDWSATPLGPPETWPQSLRTAVRILLNTNHPMFIWWGPELIQFYNDAYRQTMGPERHPSALGQRGRECWEEIWPIIGPQIEQVMSGGGATWHENQLVPVTRHGRLEQVYWTYGYSPIDEDDRVGGVLVVCRDVTKDYLAAAALREREAELARVQQIGRIGGLEVDLRTGFRNRRSPEYLLIHGLPPDAANEIPRGLGPAHPSRGSRGDREEIPRCRRRQGARIHRAVPDHSSQRRRDALDFGQIHHRARRKWQSHPPGRRAYRCHRTGGGGAGASAKRGALPQARRPARRAERDAGAARRGKDPGTRPHLERVAGSPGGRRPQRRLANGQPGMDPNARLERGRIAEPYLGMAGASRRQRT